MIGCKRKRPDRRAIRAPCVTIARQPPWTCRGQRPQSQPQTRTRPKGQDVRTNGWVGGENRFVTELFGDGCVYAALCVGVATGAVAVASDKCAP